MGLSINMLLTEENLYQQLIDNSNYFSIKQIKEDLKLVSQINSSISRYKKTGKLNLRLFLNYFIILNNSFGNFTSNIILYKLDDYNIDVAITILDFLYILPVMIEGYNTELIERDKQVQKMLENI